MAAAGLSAHARARQPRPPEPSGGRREWEKRPRGAPWEESLGANFKWNGFERRTCERAGAGS